MQTIRKYTKEYFQIMKLNIYHKQQKNYKLYLQMHFIEFTKYQLENMEMIYMMHKILQIK